MPLFKQKKESGFGDAKPSPDFSKKITRIQEKSKSLWKSKRARQLRKDISKGLRRSLEYAWYGD